MISHQVSWSIRNIWKIVNLSNLPNNVENRDFGELNLFSNAGTLAVLPSNEACQRAYCTMRNNTPSYGIEIPKSLPTEAISDNYSMNFIDQRWNLEVSQNENTETTSYLSQDTPNILSSNPSDSLHTLCRSSRDDNTLSKAKVYDLQTTRNEIPRFENLHYTKDDTTNHRNLLSSTACLPTARFCVDQIGYGNDLFTGLNFDINPSSDSMAFNTKSSTEHTSWDDSHLIGSITSSLIGSPEIHPLFDDWKIPLSTNSPVCFSSPLHVSSPACMKHQDIAIQPKQILPNDIKIQDVGPRNSRDLNDLMVASNHSPTMASEISDDFPKLFGHSSTELENNAREHPLYHNVSPGDDGLYHCPWENDPSSNCQHKPEKLKCNYDKFVDSHLKPYRCKVLSCKDLSFSSTACLLRHEREAHAMHGHGDKPFLCIYEGCDRGINGNGFPRHWNLRDHMKRVHNDLRYPKSNASTTSQSTAAVKGRKRKLNDTFQASSKRVSTSSIFKQSNELRLPILNEIYRENYKTLIETAKKLQDPMYIDNMKLLRNVNDCIKILVETTQKITSAQNTTKPAG